MRYSKKAVYAVIAVLAMIVGMAQPANADENVAPASSSSDSVQDAFPPMLPWQVTNISGGGRYNFNGNTLGGTLYTLRRVTGKTSYIVHFDQISCPVTTTVYRRDSLTAKTRIMSSKVSANGAVMGFGAANTGQSFFLEFTSGANSCAVKGYIY